MMSWALPTRFTRHTLSTPSSCKASSFELGMMNTEKVTGKGLWLTSLTRLEIFSLTRTAPRLTSLWAGSANSIYRQWCIWLYIHVLSHLSTLPIYLYRLIEYLGNYAFAFQGDCFPAVAIEFKHNLFIIPDCILGSEIAITQNAVSYWKQLWGTMYIELWCTAIQAGDTARTEQMKQNTTP